MGSQGEWLTRREFTIAGPAFKVGDGEKKPINSLYLIVLGDEY
jgi:hypothetical protein